MGIVPIVFSFLFSLFNLLPPFSPSKFRAIISETERIIISTRKSCSLEGKEKKKRKRGAPPPAQEGAESRFWNEVSIRMVKSRSKAERIKSKGALALKRRSRQTKENDKRDGETETATTTTTNTAAAAALKGPKGLGKERKSRKREKFLTKLVSAHNNALKAKAAIGKVSFVFLSLSLSNRRRDDNLGSQSLFLGQRFWISGYLELFETRIHHKCQSGTR